MGIRTTCPNGHALHIKAHLAGQRAICPHCGAKFAIPPAPIASKAAGAVAEKPSQPVRRAGTPPATIPGPPPPPTTDESSSGDDLPPDSPTGSDPIAAALEAVWYVRPPAGGQFGPAKGPLLRDWVDQGRVSPVTLVWREDWPQWQRAGRVFPELAEPIDPPAPALPPAAPPSSLERGDVFPVAGGDLKSGDKPPQSKADDDLPHVTPIEAPPKLDSSLPASTDRLRRAQLQRILVLLAMFLAILALLPILIYVLTHQ